MTNMNEFIKPSYELEAFNCPHCDAYSEQLWNGLFTYDYNTSIYSLINHYKVANCRRCNKLSIWFNKSMIYPNISLVQIPNQDLPEDVKKDYLEAAAIIRYSPRGAASLLRLALQKLCKFLGEEGNHLDTDIKALHAKGLNVKLHKAFEIVRVIGNNAVHPGEINIDDDEDTALKLFSIINILAQDLITNEKEIIELFENKMPEKIKKKFD